MEARKKVSKQELAALDLSQFDKGVEDLALEGVKIDLNQKRKEVLEAFEERSRAHRSHNKILETLREVKEERRKVDLMMKEFIKTRSIINNQKETIH